MPATPESILLSSFEDFDVFIFCICFGLPMHIGLVHIPKFSGPPFSPISSVLLVCFSTAWYIQHFNSVENFRYKKYSLQHSKMCPCTFKVIPLEWREWKQQMASQWTGVYQKYRHWHTQMTVISPVERFWKLSTNGRLESERFGANRLSGKALLIMAWQTNKNFSGIVFETWCYQQNKVCRSVTAPISEIQTPNVQVRKYVPMREFIGIICCGEEPAVPLLEEGSS